jgi:hypothetical protein
MSSGMMMEAVRSSETSVDNYFTRQYIPEDNSEHSSFVSNPFAVIRNLRATATGLPIHDIRCDANF